MRQPRRRVRGFTLIELLIVLSLIAILAAVAYPSYQEQIETARRAEAQGLLMEAAQFMERVYSETGCYNPGADYGCSTADDGAPTLPVAHDFYGFAASAAAADTFTLRAFPTDSQAGNGILEVDNLGRKFWDEDSSCAEDGSTVCVYGATEKDWDRG